MEKLSQILAFKILYKWKYAEWSFGETVSDFAIALDFGHTIEEAVCKREF